MESPLPSVFALILFTRFLTSINVKLTNRVTVGIYLSNIRSSVYRPSQIIAVLLVEIFVIIASLRKIAPPPPTSHVSILLSLSVCWATS